MEYKRITGRDNWCGCVTIKNGTSKGEIWERLAELEDKIENATLVELPCKLGTPVYCLLENDYVLDGEKKRWIYTIEELKFDFNVFGLWEYGETFFLTREEAEKKLEDLKNGR